MLQAPGLEDASDDDSVVSVEETPEEARQRRLLKKQLARRERDKKLMREQSRRRVQREKDMLSKAKEVADEEERRRQARWGAIPLPDAAKAGNGPREQDVPQNRAETLHPASWVPYPKKRIAEVELMDGALKSPVTFGYRVEYEKEAKQHKIPLPTKFRDPQLLEKRCRVCAWSVDGCPGCWRPAQRAIGYKKLGTVKGAKPDGVGIKGSFGKGAVTHTPFTSATAIASARRSLCFVNVYIKAVPAGEIVHLNLEAENSIAYVCWQFRNQSPAVGFNDSLALLFPTESGLVYASPEKSFGGDLTAAFDFGSYKLRDYKLDRPGVSGSFFYVAKISESMTPRLIQAFYRSNFTLSRPWLTRILRHLSLLPAGGLSEDDAQVKITAWMSTASAEMEKWIRYEEEKVAAARLAADTREAETKKQVELDEKKVSIKQWQKARRRDAREKLLAALEESGLS